MIVPELPAEIAELKRQVGRFIEAEVYPVEQRIAERNEIDHGEVDALFAKARAAGFSMLNMPVANGGRDLSMLGQVALEEESGKATNGLGFAVVERGPRELLEIATPEQVERYVMPIVRGEFREAWALTEPGAGSDLGGLQSTADREGDEWVLNGEKWFVTSERTAGVYIVAAMTGDEQTLFLVEPDTPGIEIQATPRFLHDPYLDLHPEVVFRDCRVPETNRIRRAATRAPRNGSWSSACSSPHAAVARRCGCSTRRRAGRRSARRSAAPIIENQGVSFPLADSLTELHAARLLTYHAAHAFDVLADRKVVHGKVSMAKLYASEMAGRVADRAVQIFGGRGYSHDTAAARFYRELRVDRIWEGTSEIQRLIIARGLEKRGAAPYLGWE